MVKRSNEGAKDAGERPGERLGERPGERIGGAARAGETGRGARGAALWAARRLPGLPDDPAEVLRAIFGLDTGAALRAVHGRATLLWPAARDVVVKRYERGEWGDAWRDWRARGAVRSFARREAENLIELRELGLPTPRALGWCGSDGWRGVGRRSALWMEHVEHRASLRDELERHPAAAERWCDELARLTARMHAAGWRHRDYYLQHWLVAERGLVLIDVGRCERESGMRQRWLVKDLAALDMSCPARVGARTRLRFLARYFGALGVEGRAQKRRFAAEIRSKSRRMAAHEPRHVDTRPAAAARASS